MKKIEGGKINYVYSVWTILTVEILVVNIFVNLQIAIVLHLIILQFVNFIYNSLRIKLRLSHLLICLLNSLRSSCIEYLILG